MKMCKNWIKCRQSKLQLKIELENLFEKNWNWKVEAKRNLIISAIFIQQENTQANSKLKFISKKYS